MIDHHDHGSGFQRLDQLRQQLPGTRAVQSGRFGRDDSESGDALAPAWVHALGVVFGQSPFFERQ